MSGRNWAIAIGINHYTNLRPLKFADRDAVAMRDFLQRELAAEVVYFAADAPPIEASQGNFASSPTFGHLSSFLLRRFEKPFLQPGDNLWFFFAGHGLRANNRDYLLASDSDPRDPERMALHVGWVVEQLRRSGADNVLLFLDACRDAGGRRDGSLGFGGEEQRGVVILSACSPEQASYELEDLKQGAFTYALLEGLRLQGAGNCATIDRLYKHLQTRVPALTQAKPTRQTPYACIEPLNKQHLILLPSQATVADTEPLRRQALRADRDRRYAEARALWIRVLAVSPADAEAIEEIERLAQLRGGSRLPPRPRDPGGDRGTGVWGQLPLPRRQVLQWLGYGGAGLVGSGVIYALTRPSEPVGVSPSPVPSASRTPTPVSPTPAPSTPAPTPSPQPTATPRPALPLQSFEVAVVKLDAQGKETVTSPDPKPQQFVVTLPGNVPLEMVQIPAGEFQMGSPENEAERSSDEEPQHKVTVPEFFMGRYPVTQAQWKAIAGLPKVKLDLKPDPSRFKGDRRPVEQVNWFDTLEFCARLSAYAKLGSQALEFRLPSEAEWEYACRAGTTTPFHFGPTLTDKVANYRANEIYGSGPKGEYREQTTEVGYFKRNQKEIANNFGVSDMHGNVWEWCSDWWFGNYNGAPTDGSARRDKDNYSRSAWAQILADWKSGQFDTEQAQKQERLVRGGSWANGPRGCRSASRHPLELATRSNGIGFRFCCSVARTP